MSNLHLQINEYEINWNDEGESRKAQACKGCAVETKGRADLESPTRHFANQPCCLTCAMNIGFNQSH